MKHLLALTFAFTLTFSMISCGPSDADKKADSLEVDSTAKAIDNDADRMIDSMNRADSINNLMQKHIQDSAHLADSMKNLKK
ncbi:hypothetical protein BH09BAC5_BH09BAC5_02280 [soil metagenome]